MLPKQKIRATTLSRWCVLMTDRLRTLSVLERLRRHEMALEARELGIMRAHVAHLDTARRELLDKMRTEARIVTIEAAPYVGAYLRAVRNEDAQIDRALAKAAPRVAALEASVLTQFRNVATIRLALAQAKAATKANRAQREAVQTDAQTLIRWTRRK